jgi:SAM-dependent methyltransferase
LQRAPGRHLLTSRCRRTAFDVVIVHQVLHFLDDGARAIHEAARVLRPGRPPAGRSISLPHDLEFLRDEHAHRRLGFASDTVAQWMKAA